jgi:hypothetical protein
LSAAVAHFRGAKGVPDPGRGAEQSPAEDVDVRLQYLEGQVAALSVAARRLSGESMTFVDEARVSLGADAADALERFARAPSREAARADLERHLPGRGPIHERYATFSRRHAVPPNRVLPTMRAAVDICRASVGAHIALAAAERVEVEPATDLDVHARAKYLGDFVTRFALGGTGINLARLVWLAAHETYPGHHVQHVLADDQLVRTRNWRERALFPSFGRHLLCAEGAAEAGAALLLDGPVFEDVCRDLAGTAGVSRAASSQLVALHRAVTELDIEICGIARDYLDGGVGTEQTATRLAEDALVAQPHQFIFTIERQRTRILAYPVGRRLVMEELDGLPVDRRWQRLASVNTTLTLPLRGTGSRPSH